MLPAEIEQKYIIRPLNHLSRYLAHLIRGKLWLKVLAGIILGAILGLILNPESGNFNENQGVQIGRWLKLPGEIFMKLVQMVMIPLIFSSIITGLVSNISDKLKTFGLSLFIYFVITTLVAISVGIGVAYLFQPGKFFYENGGFSAHGQGAHDVHNQSEFPGIPESISNLIPVNPLEAILQGEMLSVVIFSIIIGIAMTQMEKLSGEPVLRFIEAIQKICMIIVGWAMRLVPYAVFGLIAALLSSTGPNVFIGLGYYMLVVLLGLLILFIFYLLVYHLFVGKNPFTFLKNIKDAQLLAFSTASSAAVMPLSMKVADEKLGVSSSVSDFVIPIGATVNMDGTALFQCVTVFFMAQAYGIELAPSGVLLITVTVVSASIGTPAIPGGGVVVLATVLKGVGIPAEGLLVIVGIDRILGMFRTAVNVTGDLTAAAIFNRWFGHSRITAASENPATNKS